MLSMANVARNFGELTLLELRTECRKRGAKASGRKAELVERLEAYERNRNFGPAEAEHLEAEFKMTLPSADLYRNMHCDSVVPAVDLTSSKLYLKATAKKMAEIQDLYDNEHLMFLRMACKDGNTFIRGQVKASMKANCNYFVDILLDTVGLVCESQCECPVGMGPSATCKHIGIILLAMVSHAKKEDIIRHKTCTQTLQTFHVPRKVHGGSPVKTSMLAVGIKNPERLLEDPRPEEFKGLPSYPDRFRNTWLGSCHAATTVLSRLYPTANVRAVSNDHSYSKVKPESMFLAQHGVTRTTQKEMLRIEMNTRGQRNSKEWHEQRRMKITSSYFGSVCKATNPSALAESLLTPKDLSKVPAIKHGIKYEHVAVKKLEEALKIKTKQCGLFVSQRAPYLASSPDGVIKIDDELCCVEVKCPFASKDQQISPLTVPYLKEEGPNMTLTLRENHDYFYQVQGQMFCTGTQKCYFAVYTTVDFRFFVINRDEAFITVMCEKLKAFFDVHFKQALLEKYLYKSFT